MTYDKVLVNGPNVQYNPAESSSISSLVVQTQVNPGSGQDVTLATQTDITNLQTKINDICYIPATNDYAGILAAFNYAVAAGGGIVKLLPVTYNIGANTLGFANNVRYEGSGYNLQYGTAGQTGAIPDSGLTTLLSGTIVQGNGTADIFDFNNVDLTVALASQQAFSQAGLTNVGISRMGIRNGLRGIKGGAYLNPSFWYSNFDDLWIEDCSINGYWFENYLHCNFKNIRTARCGTTTQQYDANGIDITGAQVHAMSGGSNLGGGNSWYESLYNVQLINVNINTRAVRFIARGASGFGSICAEFIQSNRFNQQTTTQATTVAYAALTTVVISGTAGQFGCAAATLVAGQIVTISGTEGGTGSITGYTNPTSYLIGATNGTTTFTLTNLNGTPIVTTAGTPTGLTYTQTGITITDGTKFAKEMPVSFQNSALTYTGGQQIFFVTSVVGNVIQVSNTVGGAPVNATGSGAGLGNCYSMGFPCIEFVGYDTSTLTIEEVARLDLEAGGTAKMVLQRANGTFSGNGIGTGAESIVEICNRGGQVRFDNSYGALIRVDTDSASNFVCMGEVATMQRNPPIGAAWIQGKQGFNFNSSGGSTDFVLFSTGFGNVVQQNTLTPLAQQPYTFNNAAATPKNINPFCQAITFNGTANGGMELLGNGSGGAGAQARAITANAVGVIFDICNPTVYTLTIYPYSTNSFNNNGAGSPGIVMSANSCCKLRADVLNGTYFWAVLSTVGTVTIT